MVSSRVVRSVLAFAAGAALLTVEVRVDAQAGARERTMYVSAVDSKGDPVEGLAVDDFIVREDEIPREVLRVTPAFEPMAIAVLADNSAASRSMLVRMREALRSFVTRMAPPDNQVAIVGLAARPTILMDYTSNPERLEDGIGRIFPETNTGMTFLDALVEVSSGLHRREAPRAVIVAVISDGLDVSDRYAREAIREMRRAGAALHAVTVGTFPIGGHIERERAFTLDEGTRTTGGQRVALLSDTGLGHALQKLARELSSQYKVVYGRPDTLIQPEKITVAAARAGVTMRGTPARGQTGD